MSSSRSAFSLIELLVVIAIIGVLVALLVPAVQKVREAAARTECTNNLKQQALALHSYANNKGHLPPAYKTTSTGVQPGWGWATYLLPYIEQGPLYDTLNPDNNGFALGNPATPSPLQQVRVSVYRCPSNDAPDTNPKRFDFGTSHYRAVCGPATYPAFVENQDMKGVMFQNSRIRFSGITDGTSNTLALGECIYDASKQKHAAIWAGMTGNSTDPTKPPMGARISDVMWWIDDTGTPDSAGGFSTINGTSTKAFSSQHTPNGANFAFCDGTVRFFMNGGDMTILKWLAGRADGNPVTLE